MKIRMLVTFFLLAILMPLDAVAGPATPFIPVILSAMSAAAVGAAASSMIGGDKDVPTITAADQKPVAPTPDDSASRRAREKALQRRYSGQGRVSTILTDESNQLG